MKIEQQTPQSGYVSDDDEDGGDENDGDESVTSDAAPQEAVPAYVFILTCLVTPFVDGCMYHLPHSLCQQHQHA